MTIKRPVVSASLGGVNSELMNLFLGKVLKVGSNAQGQGEPRLRNAISTPLRVEADEVEASTIQRTVDFSHLTALVPSKA